MGGIFSKSSPKLPPVPDPEPIPEVADETGDVARRLAKARSAFSQTILTGNLTPFTGKKSTLG